MAPASTIPRPRINGFALSCEDNCQRAPNQRLLSLPVEETRINGFSPVIGFRIIMRGQRVLHRRTGPTGSPLERVLVLPPEDWINGFLPPTGSPYQARPDRTQTNEFCRCRNRFTIYQFTCSTENVNSGGPELIKDIRLSSD